MNKQQFGLKYSRYASEILILFYLLLRGQIMLKVLVLKSNLFEIIQ